MADFKVQVAELLVKCSGSAHAFMSQVEALIKTPPDKPASNAATEGEDAPKPKRKRTPRGS